MTLQPTYGYFEAIGKVTGINSDRAFSEGSKNDLKWNRLQFGLKVSKNSFLYVELMGNKTDKIRMYKNNSNDELEDNRYELVKWDDIYKHQYNHLKLPQLVSTNAGLSSDEEKKLIAYDAIDYFKDNLKNNQTVLIKGLMQLEEYEGKIQEKFQIRKLYEIEESLYDESIAKAFFTQEIVYIGLDGNQILSKIIKGTKGNVEIFDYSFTTNNVETISFLKGLETGSTIKVHGNIRNYVPIDIVEGFEVITGPAVKELEITGGSTESLVRGRYSTLELTNNIIKKSPFEEDDYGF